jgi:hypothetical protein
MMWPGVIDARLYGARPDDTTDVGPPLCAAIQAAQTHGCGIVHLPAGPKAYWLNTPVVIPGGVTIQGDGWEPSTGYFSGVHGAGTWIHITNTDFVPFTMEGVAPTLRRIAFDHEQPVPAPAWAPMPYPFTVEVIEPGGDARIHDVLFWRATKAIRQRCATGQGYARLNVRRVLGQIFEMGIEVEFTADVCRIQDIHWWPFWEVSPSVLDYATLHAVGIQSWRNDNPQFHSLFSYALSWGMYFGQNAYGSTGKFKLMNADFDHTRVGIEIGGDEITGQIVNMTTQGDTLEPSLGFHVTGHHAQVEVANLSVGPVTTNAVRVANDSTVMLSNLRCDQWDLLARGFPALETATGGQILLGSIPVLTHGRGGAPYAGMPFCMPTSALVDGILTPLTPSASLHP